MGSGLFRQFVAAPVVVAVAAGGSLLLSGAADAAPLGALTFAPPTGSDTTIITATTSGGCDPASSAADLEVTGPVGSASPVFPPGTVVTATQESNFSTTDPFGVGEAISLHDSAAVLNKTLVAGEYDFTVTCQDQFTGQPFGTFTGPVFFTDPTHYTTGAVQPPSPSPTASASPSASDTTTPEPSPNGIAGMSTPSAPGSGTHPLTTPGTLVRNDAPITLIFLGGLVLLAAGLMFVIWLRRPRKAVLGDDDDTAGRPPGDHVQPT